jgi:hypothetical protein
MLFIGFNHVLGFSGLIQAFPHLDLIVLAIG